MRYGVSRRQFGNAETTTLLDFFGLFLELFPMRRSPSILREPSGIIIRAENGARIYADQESATLWRHRDVEVSLSLGGRGMGVDILSHELPVTHVELRWLQSVPLGGVFLPDHWERGYGDLCWRGMQPDLPCHGIFCSPTGQERTRPV